MITLKIAFRNIFRQRRRSILTGLTMLGGLVLFSISIGLLEGSYGDIIDLFTSDHTGHIQVHKQGYLDRPTLYNTVNNYGILEERIGNHSEVKALTPRLYSTALSFLGKKTTVVRIIGIDPIKEGRAMRLPEMIKEGRFLSEASTREVVIGAGAAEILHAGIGDEISLLGQGADGSIAHDSYQIAGIIGKSNGSYNRISCYMHLQQAQRLLALENRVHEIAVILKNQDKSRMVAMELADSLDDGGMDVAPWQVVEKQFYMAMQADTKGSYIMQGIIMFIVAIGVLNTVLMTILERTREFGVLRALGTRPTVIFRLILYETGILSLISIGLGSLVSWGLNYYLSIHGIAFPPVEWAGFVFETMESEVNFKTFWLPGAVTFCTALMVSILPALRAARVTPVEAMRFH